jgi:hypothetical protein
MYGIYGTSGLRFLPMPKEYKKKHKSNVLIIPGSMPGLMPGLMPDLMPGLMPSLMSPIISPVLGGPILGAPGSPVIPLNVPGAFLQLSPTTTGAGTIGAAGTTSTSGAGSGAGAGAGAAGAGAGAGTGATGQTYNLSVITPPITNIRQISFPDNDPELRRKVVKYFYDRLKDIYFHGKFQKLLKYIVIENNIPRLVKSYEELQKNIDNKNDISIRIKFITENIFSKYDLEVLISKLIQKYGMLFSDDEYNMHWYNAKNKYSSKVKKAMYKKIKYRLQKKVHF